MVREECAKGRATKLQRRNIFLRATGMVFRALMRMKILRTFCEKGPKNHPGRTEEYVASLKLGCTAFRTLLTDHEMAQMFIPKMMVTAPVDDKSSTGEGSGATSSDDAKKRKLGNK
jgi:hypothetical protein